MGNNRSQVELIKAGKAYVDLEYSEVLKLSATYQGGVIAWVAFWATYGQGFGAETMASALSFAAAYAVVILIEPIADLAVLATAKTLRRFEGSPLVDQRLYQRA